MAAKEHFTSKNNTVIEYALGFKHKQQTKYVEESLKTTSQNSFTNLNSNSVNSMSNYDSLNKTRSVNIKPHQHWYDNNKTQIKTDYQPPADPYIFQANNPQETQQYIVESNIQQPKIDPQVNQHYIIREIYVKEPIEQQKIYSNQIIEPKNVYQKEVVHRYPDVQNEKFYSERTFSNSKMKSFNDTKTVGEEYDGEAYDLCSKGYEKLITKLFGSKKCCIYATVITVILIIAVVAFLLFCFRIFL